MNIQNELGVLHAALGHKPLNRTFAKFENFAGLCAARAGLWLERGLFASTLFVLAGYLALAGHRSHL